MVSQWEFKNLERELSSIEQQLKSFEKSLDSIVEPISSARFNDRDYGEKAVEKKIDEIINDSKRRIERKYNDYLNGVRRAADDSTERIKREALSASQQIERLNTSLSEWATLNKAFDSKDYHYVIEHADSFDIHLFDKELKDSLLLLKLESYDNLCRSDIGRVSESNYANYTTYFSLCSENNTPHHIVRAAVLLLQASASIMGLYSGNKKQLYIVCRNGLRAYSVLPENDKTRFSVEYQKCYSTGLELYNMSCDSAYNKFDYPTVKVLLIDSKLFNQADIRVEFFRAGKTDAKTLFDYYRAYGHNATNEIVDMVYEDTKGLLDTSEYERYTSYWMTRYDDHKLKYITQIVNAKGDKLSVFGVLLTSLLENGTAIMNSIECLSDMANFYSSVLLSEKNAVNLWSFAKNAVLWNKYIKQVQSYAISEAKDTYKNGAKVIDDITYPMINKYKKLCNGFDKELIAELNVVMDATSMRLFGKRYIKNLKCLEENSTSKSTTVKLITMELKAKNKKKLLLGCLIGVAVIAIIVVIIILCK